VADLGEGLGERSRQSVVPHDDSPQAVGQRRDQGVESLAHLGLAASRKRRRPRPRWPGRSPGRRSCRTGCRGPGHSVGARATARGARLGAPRQTSAGRAIAAGGPNRPRDRAPPSARQAPPREGEGLTCYTRAPRYLRWPARYRGAGHRRYHSLSATPINPAPEIHRCAHPGLVFRPSPAAQALGH
jgi:hypothetical protein